jgi:chorismate mutase
MLQESLKPSNLLSENLEKDKKHNPSIEMVRVEIDDIDSQILKLLGRRMQCAQAIGAYKKANNLPILQVARWQEILNIAVQKGHELDLSGTFVTQFLTAIHEESIRHQTLVVNSPEENI